jgi:hypothetical protein
MTAFPVVLRRRVRVDATGELEQELVISQNEVVKRTRGSRYYSETSIRRSKLGEYGITAIHYLRGFEAEGNNQWRSYMIIPTDPSQIDALWGRIKDFDTFGAVAKCLHEICLRGGDCGGYRDAVICDLNICMTLMCDMSPCL